MKVHVNGEATDVKDGCTVAELLEQLDIGRERVAVEISLQIVPKAQYDSHTLQDADRIEIVHFVGGG